MKHLVVVLALMVGITASAQEKDITKFLGIPIDGTKSEMVQKLKEKGFTPTSYDEYTLEGEFNGRDVTVSPVTNNNKVYRIAVFDQIFESETSIKNRFNILCSQFENNQRYFKVSEESLRIAEDERISYEMLVNKKRYEAAYWQKTIKTDEELAVIDGIPFNADVLKQSGAIELLAKKHSTHKLVWFMIDEQYGKYRILMFYDNVLNQATGEDL